MFIGETNVLCFVVNEVPYWQVIRSGDPVFTMKMRTLIVKKRESTLTAPLGAHFVIFQMEFSISPFQNLRLLLLRMVLVVTVFGGGSGLDAVVMLSQSVHVSMVSEKDRSR